MYKQHVDVLKSIQKTIRIDECNTGARYTINTEKRLAFLNEGKEGIQSHLQTPQKE